jgi:hypothetical protein
MAAQHKCEVVVRRKGSVHKCNAGARHFIDGIWKCTMHAYHVTEKRARLNQRLTAEYSGAGLFSAGG